MFVLFNGLSYCGSLYHPAGGRMLFQESSLLDSQDRTRAFIPYVWAQHLPARKSHKWGCHVQKAPLCALWSKTLQRHCWHDNIHWGWVSVTGSIQRQLLSHTHTSKFLIWNFFPWWRGGIQYSMQYGSFECSKSEDVPPGNRRLQWHLWYLVIFPHKRNSQASRLRKK